MLVWSLWICSFDVIIPWSFTRGRIFHPLLFTSCAYSNLSANYGNVILVKHWSNPWTKAYLILLCWHCPQNIEYNRLELYRIVQNYNHLVASGASCCGWIVNHKTLTQVTRVHIPTGMCIYVSLLDTSKWSVKFTSVFHWTMVYGT